LRFWQEAWIEYKNNFERCIRWQEVDGHWVPSGKSYVSPFKQTVATFIRLRRHRARENRETFTAYVCCIKTLVYGVRQFTDRVSKLSLFTVLRISQIYEHHST